ncbi:MAG: hypothetical protein N4A45_09645 [Flavobacteriales bacterium]|jgi:gliding motility-associated lipoprotein GldD|nr:hypothetical protein [Flavobacteriales bacterium]
MIKRLLAFFFMTIVMVSCSEDFQPKPKGYFRIEPLKKNERKFDVPPLPLTFSFPDYFKIKWKDVNQFNLTSPYYSTTIHCTYMPVQKGNFEENLTESIKLTLGHIKRAAGMDEKIIEDFEKKKYGIRYKILGEVASPIQFVVTDSFNHIFRASLYYDLTPNVDSLRPIYNEVEKDVEQILSTLEWRDPS